MMYLILILFFLLSLPASILAQSGKPTMLADLAKYKGSDREQLLYEGAKKEGKLVWYTSLVPHKHIAKVFQSKYPGVEVDVYRAAGSALATRLVEESRAQRYLADAIESTPPQLMLLRDINALQPYSSPHLANYPDVAKEDVPGGLVLWTTDRESLIGVGYNTNKLAAADVPKKFDDLLKPALAPSGRCSKPRGKRSYAGSKIRSCSPMRRRRRAWRGSLFPAKCRCRSPWFRLT